MIALALCWYLGQCVTLVLALTSTTCPPTTFAQAVSARATFECVEAPPAWCESSQVDCVFTPETLYGILLCPSGERPINVDGRRIVCEAVRT